VLICSAFSLTRSTSAAVVAEAVDVAVPFAVNFALTTNDAIGVIVDELSLTREPFAVVFTNVCDVPLISADPSGTRLALADALADACTTDAPSRSCGSRDSENENAEKALNPSISRYPLLESPTHPPQPDA
jgi:hypothetical protein